MSSPMTFSCHHHACSIISSSRLQPGVVLAVDACWLPCCKLHLRRHSLLADGVLVALCAAQALVHGHCLLGASCCQQLLAAMSAVTVDTTKPAPLGCPCLPVCCSGSGPWLLSSGCLLCSTSCCWESLCTWSASGPSLASCSRCAAAGAGACTSASESASWSACACACVHELLLGIPLQIVRFWAFWGIMFQVRCRCPNMCLWQVC